MDNQGHKEKDKASISINIRFWTDGRKNSDRNRNTEYCWNELKKLNKFLKKNGVEAQINLFDFSEEKQFDDAIHHKFDRLDYKLAEKTNKIIEYNANNNIDVMMVMDGDLFFSPEDYELLPPLLTSVRYGDIITFDALNVKFDNLKLYSKDDKVCRSMVNPKKYFYTPFPDKGPLHSCGGGLGGTFIIHTKLIQSIGGFNIEYESWGGEDGDALNRLWGKRFKERIQLRSQREFCPLHIDHFRDFKNKNYKNKNNPHLIKKEKKK